MTSVLTPDVLDRIAEAARQAPPLSAEQADRKSVV